MQQELWTLRHKKSITDTNGKKPLKPDLVKD